MNVKELIELTNQLALGKEAPTDKERALYLSFLNVANNKFYNIAAAGLNTIGKIAEIFLDEATQSFKLPNDLYTIVKLNFITLVKTHHKFIG